jgi:starch synthase (maltosyl-transferring)
VDNEQLIAYSKNDEKLDNIILVIVNLDPFHKQSGFVDVPLELFQLDPDQEFQVRDLLTGESYRWRGVRNYVELAPSARPAHVFSVRRRV